MKKMSLDRKIIFGFTSCILILGTVVALSFNNSKKFLETNKWVNHTHEVISGFDQVLLDALNAQNGMRGYVITGNEDFLEYYNVAGDRIWAQVDNLRELTKDNPTQQRNLDKLNEEIRLYMEYQQRCVNARKISMEGAVTMVSTGEGKNRTDRIRAILKIGQDIEKRLLVEREIENNESAENFTLVFIVLVISIAIVLLLVFVMITSNLRALRKAEKETAEKNWNLTGSSILTTGMAGNKTVVDLAQSIIDQLAVYVNAQAGVIYLNSKTDVGLEWTCGYAIPEPRHKLVAYGEGIIGQVSIKKEKILVTNITPEQFPIQTGFGNIVPKNILAIPFLDEGEVIGVIELASVQGFNELEIGFLESVMNAIGIAVTAAQSREEVKELLEETQRQSEELETQQEELRQSNEELSEKTLMLEKSEAELKAQQEELQQSNEELTEQTRLLEDQKEKLENARFEMENKARELEVTGKYKSDFLANMSHELRTPLNSILILSELMAENKSKVLGPKEIDFARNINRSGNDLLNLINEILDLSKIEAGKLELEIEDVPLQDIVQDMQAMFTELANKKQVKFIVNCSPDLEGTTISTDRQRTEQVIKNLLSNAFKFTSKNGRVELNITKASKDILFNQSQLAIADGVVSFSITDTGIGIPEEKRALIFEAFQQGDGSTKRKYGGTGLGLSISRELTHALGGEIQLRSEEGVGSTFTLFLPAKFDTGLITLTSKKVEIRDSGEQVTTEKNQAPKTKEKAIVEVHEDKMAIDDRYAIKENDRSILIMEDDEAFSRVLLDFVRKRHYKGIIAAQGNTGISYARYYKPDAILLDMNLPVMDGIEVLKLLKNDPQLRHIPVQIISALDKKQIGLEMGAFNYIRKPVTIKDLQGAFEKIEGFSSKKLKKLLVVEDNADHNQAIRELIGNGDVKCFPAYSGSEAMEALNAGDVDCVILDLGLPDISGFELLEKIKAIDHLHKIPVVVYTGRSLTPEENNRLNKLASTVILKTADSKERLLDETALFLHRVESKLPKEKQTIIRKLHKSDEILHHKKVLLVDDDIRNIYSLTNALEEEEVICIAAENGKEAMLELEKNPDIDLVLLDIMMPEMDGYETIEAIRKKPALSKLPVIALTAKAMKGDREKCLASGMSDYIAKPVNVEQLLSLMRVWLYK